MALWLLRLTYTLTYLLTLNTRGAQKPCPGNDFLRRLPASGGILSLDISWVIKHSNKIPPHIFGVKLFNAATSGIAWRRFRQKSNMAVVKMKCTDFTALWMIKDNFQYPVNDYKWPRTGRRRIIKMVLWSRQKPEVVLTSTRNKISASVHRLWPCFRRCQSNVTMSCNARKRQRPKNQHGIHKSRKYSTTFDFWTLVFIQLGRMSVSWLWRPRKHVYSSWNVEMPCSIPKLLPFPVCDAIQYGGRKPKIVITSVRNNVVVKFYCL